MEPMRMELLGMIMSQIIDRVTVVSKQKESKMSRKKRMQVMEDLAAKRRYYDIHERATIVKKLSKPGASLLGVT